MSRRTLAERAEFLSADEAALALGMHQRALKRRIRSAAITPPAKFKEQGRYLFTEAEVERAREELGIGRPLARSETEHEAEPDGGTTGEPFGTRWSQSALANYPGLARMARMNEEAHSALVAKLAAINFVKQPAWRMPFHLANVNAVVPAASIANQIASNYDWMQSLERTVRWAADIEARHGIADSSVPPGQVQAFPDEDAGAPAEDETLGDLLAALRETNRLLRALLAAQSRAVE